MNGDKESYCPAYPSFKKLLNCLPPTLRPPANFNMQEFKQKYRLTASTGKVALENGYNPLSRLQDSVQNFYSQKLKKSPYSVICKDDMTEFLTSLLKEKSLSVFEYLAWHCYIWQISKSGSDIINHIYVLHRTVQSVIDEIGDDTIDADDYFIYKLRLLEQMKHVICSFIEIYEYTTKAEAPYDNRLMTNVIKAKLPKSSKVSTAILKWFEIVYEEIKRHYQHEKKLMACDKISITLTLIFVLHSVEIPFLQHEFCFKNCRQFITKNLNTFKYIYNLESFHLILYLCLLICRYYGPHI
ncbi:hypothetical protein RF11_13583 [Thelohanellus kitauei]|uniref:Uncharacterized protein n=1 Tax=Thelohanellus kitauei TaxID=669202 RepID=A0A0C2J5D4_THEKT|nr:hypothetical protein RF11_13583 [Thelohanellus kitauei]